MTWRSFAFPAQPCWGTVHAAFDSGAPSGAIAGRQIVDTIYEGTRRTLEFARECRTERLLFVSSGAVYGRQPPELSHLPESYVGGPTIDLQRPPVRLTAKLKDWPRSWCSTQLGESELQASIARCFAFVGPHLPLDGSFAVGNFFADLLAGRPLKLSGDGTPWRSYLYAADLAEWLWTMLLAAPNGTVLNVGSEEALQIGDAEHRIAALESPSRKVHVARQPDPTKLAERYVPNCRRAAELLDLRARIPFDEGAPQDVGLVSALGQWAARLRLDVPRAM
ncbi:MAG: NAD(P)-dependent oxidoreductase [Pirellulales bacterium]